MVVHVARMVAKASVISTFGSHVKVVLFNPLLSASQALAITESIKVAFEMTAPSDNEAARIFAGQFYSALGFGTSVAVAFTQAVNELSLHSILDPVILGLLVREGIDARDLLLVRVA